MRALQMAINQEELQPDLIHHSDRGLQYCCYEYQQLLRDHQIQPSMTDTQNRISLGGRFSKLSACTIGPLKKQSIPTIH